MEYCKYYRKGRICTNKDYCIEQLPSCKTRCCSSTYYIMELENKIEKQYKEISELNQVISDQFSDMFVVIERDYLEELTKYASQLERRLKEIKEMCEFDEKCDFKVPLKVKYNEDGAIYANYIPTVRKEVPLYNVAKLKENLTEVLEEFFKNNIEAVRGIDVNILIKQLGHINSVPITIILDEDNNSAKGL